MLRLETLVRFGRGTMVLPVLLAACATCPSPSPQEPADPAGDDLEVVLRRAAEAADAGEPLQAVRVLAELQTHPKAAATADPRLDEAIGRLRGVIREEVTARVGAAHDLALQAEDLSDSMRQWQVGSFYLGLLPDASTPEEAADYQQLYTAHEQVRERVRRAAQLRYSIWATGNMRRFAATFRRLTVARFDDEQGVINNAVEDLGPIDTTLLRPEALQLYQSLVGAAFGALNETQRADMVHRIEQVEKEPMR